MHISVHLPQDNLYKALQSPMAMDRRKRNESSTIPRSDKSFITRDYRQQESTKLI